MVSRRSGFDVLIEDGAKVFCDRDRIVSSGRSMPDQDH